ncbi:sugar phosphate isomerase/epimerase family protein [Spirosoma utsteinense]|uniref:Sugar phosphate isomerase/epimerase n=1 Tax=Spirosoma utsteinense TaxID=2585773 RepID=A0ABR6W4I7_9BACT|nr:sugar phosphate isomerase/epimerase [Spirosoma utsteinense]MBC3786411.1 sugar phosphate isomerase/epimerase [Spirosoma utsteinense]MBC3791460.1 sugar phosphate isomerase/epimerase [Spirosoma utsteinense]
MKHLILVGLLLLTSPSLFAQSSQSIFPQTPGMVSYTYRNSFKNNVAATLDTIKALGITDMEFSNLFGKTAAELRKLLDERGMRCSSFGVGYPDLMNKLPEVGQNAKTLGAQYVRVAWVPHDGAFTLDAAKKTVADFNRFGKQLYDDFGLKFCYHNHGYEFEKHENGTLFDYIVQNTDPKYVSFELDILWTVFPGQDPAALLNKYGNRFQLMHLKDLRKGIVGNLSGGTPVENDVALGTGQIDLRAVLKAAQKAGVKHYYIEDESPSIATQVPQSIAYLKGLK